MFEIINLKDEPDSLSTLASWHQDEWSFLNPGESLDDRITRMKSCLGPGLIPSTYIAKDDVLLGSAAIVENDMGSKPQLTPWLASVFVEPRHRNKCIGRKLVQHVMSLARKEGIKKLYLFTPDKQGFYLNLGWTIMNSENFHGQDVTVMQVNLEKQQ